MIESRRLNTAEDKYKLTGKYSKIPLLRPPLGLSQRWSLIRGTLGVEIEEKNNSNFANKVFNG